MRKYLITLIVSPMDDVRSLDNLLKKRSFSIDLPDEEMVADVLIKLHGIPDRRLGEYFENLPESSVNCFTFIYTADVESTCNKVKEVLNSFKDVTYSLRSPQETMNAIGIPGDASQFNSIEEFVETAINGIINMKN